VAPLTATQPAPPHAGVKTRIAEAVEAARGEILELSHRIHAHPEPAFEEHHAAKWVAEAVARHGYVVEHPAGSLATAVRATRRGGRSGAGPRIGILAEYDALPGLGHGCGHNTMAASGVGAAIALAAVADDLPGEIVFLGTPAEERGSGKQIMIEDGLFEGLDAALLYHPCDRSHVEAIALASEDAEVVFTGLQAHAASDPWKGRNALDAMILLFSSVGLWRQQLKPSARVHGIIREGGTAANIIPDRTAAWFMIRSDDEAEYRRSIRTWRSRPRARRANRSSSATPPRHPGRMRRRCSPRRWSLRRLPTCSLTPSSSRPPGGPSARPESPTPGRVRYHRRGASRWTIGFEPAAPRARRTRPRVMTLRPSPEDLRGRPPDRP